MEVIPGDHLDAVGRKLSIDIIVGAHSLCENPRKEATVVRMGHGAQRGYPHTAGVRLYKCKC
jgi:hypothetical protein